MDINAAVGITKAVTGVVREQHPRMEAQNIDILAEIARNRGISSTEIADRVGVSLTSVTRNVDILSDGGRAKGLGLVVRYLDPEDRRTRRYQLSKQGEAFWQRVCVALDEAVSRARSSK